MSFFRILSTKQRITVAALLATGALISLFSAGQIAEHEAAENRFDFEVSAGDGAVALQRNIDDLLQALRSVTYFYSGSEFVDRREFATFVEPLLRRYEGLQALEWIPRVRGSERHIYESQARADGFADFVIRESDGNGAMVRAGNRDQYFPVFYVEPFSGNKKVFGFDLGSSPKRRQALVRSRDSGAMVASSRIKLVQETSNQSGVIIFAPIYGGAPKNHV